MKRSALGRALCAAGCILCAANGRALGGQVLQSANGSAVHALVVGIDDYAYVEPQLQGAVEDAKDLTTNLRANGVADLHVLLDREATRPAFVKEMDRLLDVSKPGDLAIITYSGHGGSVPEYPQYKGLEASGKTEEFIMADYATSGPGTGAVITNKEMKAWLSRLDRKGVDVLFIADSCFGGGMVRGIPDSRAGKPLLRVARDIAPQNGSSFEPIPMTPEELRTDVATLAHVTVLSGSDRFTPVPEVFIPEPPTRRGALSYAMARALRGNAAKGGLGVTTRRELFSYARQEVQHYSDDQRIDNSPRAGSGELSLLDRPVFRTMPIPSAPAVALTPASHETIPQTAPHAPPAQAATMHESTCPVAQIAVIHDDADAKSQIKDVGVPFKIVDDPTKSDLVWDVMARQTIQSGGDVIANHVGPAEVAGVIQRTFAVQCIKKLTAIRPQTMTLRDGIQRYTPKDAPVLEAPEVSGRYLIVFDIAADGRLQVVWPPEKNHAPMPRDTWTGNPDVIEPFGADYVVAVTSDTELSDFLDWLNNNDNRLPSVAGQVPAWLRRIQAQNTTSRIGAVALYTRSK